MGGQSLVLVQENVEDDKKSAQLLRRFANINRIMAVFIVAKEETTIEETNANVFKNISLELSVSMTQEDVNNQMYRKWMDQLKNVDQTAILQTENIEVKQKRNEKFHTILKH